jgi:hypothetical protein
MSRLYSLGSWSCLSLGLALAVVATLAVPEEAFADSGECASCATTCGETCGSDNTCYENCMAPCTQGCCTQLCGTDDSCYSSCCQAACGSDQTCYNNCEAKTPFCIQWNGNPGECNNNHRCGFGLRYCKYGTYLCLCTSF